MPIYEYSCTACGREFEALVPFAQADKVTCEVCGAHTERLASCCFGTTPSNDSAVPAGGCATGV